MKAAFGVFVAFDVLAMPLMCQFGAENAILISKLSLALLDGGFCGLYGL
jgi:hypothetical protein